jgi:hypothetical protein
VELVAGAVAGIARTVSSEIILTDMKLTQAHLRQIIREELSTEQMKNVNSEHEHTADSKRVLEMLSKSKGVMQSIKKIDNPRELVGLLQGIIDAPGVADKSSVLKALATVQGHEKKG